MHAITRETLNHAYSGARNASSCSAGAAGYLHGTTTTLHELRDTYGALLDLIDAGHTDEAMAEVQALIAALHTPSLTAAAAE